jgi:16S rRNA (uracil1498-N3)-methyltransferase
MSSRLRRKGTEYSVKIVHVDRTEVKTEIVGKTRREIAYPRVTLGQGLPKSDKMDWIAQKATELGVATIAPLVMERTIVKVKDEVKRISRWQKICREAAMQSRRPDIPNVEAPQVLRLLNSAPP